MKNHDIQDIAECFNEKSKVEVFKEKYWNIEKEINIMNKVMHSKIATCPWIVKGFNSFNKALLFSILAKKN